LPEALDSDVQLPAAEGEPAEVDERHQTAAAVRALLAQRQRLAKGRLRLVELTCLYVRERERVVQLGKRHRPFAPLLAHLGTELQARLATGARRAVLSASGAQEGALGQHQQRQLGAGGWQGGEGPLDGSERLFRASLLLQHPGALELEPGGVEAAVVER